MRGPLRAIDEAATRIVASHAPASRELARSAGEVLTAEWNARQCDEEELYSSPLYLWACLDCWRTFTARSARLTARSLRRVGMEPQRIVDFGAGIGTSTAQLAREFPDATVVYHNLPGPQVKVAEELFSELGLGNVEILTCEARLVRADVVCAYEVFEHLREPVRVLRELIGPETRMYADGSSFTIDSAGHYRCYYVDGARVSNTAIRRQFNGALLDMGMRRAPFKYWNTRPAIWVR